MKKVLFTLLGGALVTLSNAATVQLNNVVDGTSDTLFANSSGNLLTGVYAAGGYFTAGFDVATAISSNDFASLISNFVVLTSATIGANSSSLEGAYAGYVEGALTDIGNVTGANPLIGVALYTFVTDSSGFGDATAFAIVNNNLVIGDDQPTPRSYTLNPANGTLVLGTESTYTGNAGGLGNGTYEVFRLTAIPEPSTMLLGAIGALGLLRRRR